MPTYQYRCTDCSDELETVQRFTDDPLTTCPTCGGSLRKVFSAVGVVFRGSGFYATDSRPKGTADASSSGDSSGKTDPGKSVSKTPVATAAGDSSSTATSSSPAAS